MSLLQVKELSRHFGGLKAVDNVSFDVEEGTVHSVIGPNGAGKTTLFNLLTGVYTPSSGRVSFAGKDVTGFAPMALAHAGMSRTFQNLQICLNMTACENVMLGAHRRLRHGLLTGMLNSAALRRRDAECRKEALEFMEFAGVGAYADAHTTEMSFGALKRLEIARALASNPKMLLLDEPAAGLNPTETSEISTLIQSIARGGLTVMLVEHDMKMVMGISDRVTVLNYGVKLLSGTTAEVRRDPRVIKAYLGVDAPMAAAEVAA